MFNTQSTQEELLDNLIYNRQASKSSWASREFPKSVWAPWYARGNLNKTF